MHQKLFSFSLFLPFSIIHVHVGILKKLYHILYSNRVQIILFNLHFTTTICISTRRCDARFDNGWMVNCVVVHVQQLGSEDYTTLRWHAILPLLLLKLYACVSVLLYIYMQCV